MDRGTSRLRAHVKWRSAVCLSLAALLAGCGGSSAGEGGSPAAQSSAAPRSQANSTAAMLAVEPGPRMAEGEAVRFLNQATFGSTEAETASLQLQGRAAWMQSQFELPPGRSYVQRIVDAHTALVAAHPRRDPTNVPRSLLDGVIWEAYLTAPDQLRKRAGYALSQIMVVSIEGLVAGGITSVPQMASYVDTLEKGAFGNFRQLIEDVSLSPAMGYYLSHRANRAAEYPNGDTTQAPLRVPDENYAREILQLFTIGLYELHGDGTTKLVDGRPQESYTEEDVRGLARVFTGWDWAPRTDPDWRSKPMQYIASRHAPEEKRFLGVVIPAGTDGPTSLRIALDTLFNHPNTGPFIAKQLIQRLVTSNPSPDYVARVATRFADNGVGVRGDMKAVLRAVLLDTEAMSPLSASTSGKLREPVLRYTAFARNFGATYSAAPWQVGDFTDPATALGQSPMRSPSVFNFYRPGYVPPNTSIARSNLVAPEFQIATETSIAGYVNFMQRQLTAPDGGLRFSYAAEVALAGDAAALVDRLDRRLTHGAMSSATRADIVAAVNALPSATPLQRLTRVKTAVLLTVASPDYLIQR
jgi:uncharacterized protein (DUF1800 family)